MLHIGTAVFSVHFVHSVLEFDGITLHRTHAGKWEGSATGGGKSWSLVEYSIDGLPTSEGDLH